MTRSADELRLLITEALLANCDNPTSELALPPDLDPEISRALLRELANRVGFRMGVDGAITVTPESKGRLKLYAAQMRLDVASQSGEKNTVAPGSTDARNVFVVHGRNLKARQAVFDILRCLGLNPIEWDKARALTGKPNPYVGEILDAAFDNAGAVVVVLTGDDHAALRPTFANLHDEATERTWQPQPRPNVLFECGIALGRSAERTVVVQVGPAKRFTDLEGVHILRLIDTAESRKEFASRLATAGCPVETSGSDFLSAGDLKGALELANDFSEAPALTSSVAPPWLAVVTDTGSARPFWHIGKEGEKPVMQFSAHFWITNRTDQLVRIVRVDVEDINGLRLAEGPLLVRDPVGSDMYSRQELRSNWPSESTFTTFSDSVHGTAGEDFEALVVFVDALERRYKVPVSFRHL